MPARLLLVGDGPDLRNGARTARSSSASAIASKSLGEQDQVVPLLSIADLFLLPSAAGELRPRRARSDGLRRAGRRVRVGGLSEVIEHGRTGFLHALDDLDGMAASGIRLLSDPELHARIAARGRQTVK